MTRLFLATVLAISLAACGGKEDEKKPAEAPAAGEEKKDEGTATAPIEKDEGTTDEAKAEGEPAAPPVPAGDTAAATGGGDLASTMKDMVGVVKDMGKVVDDAAGDCGKMATGMDKLIAANKSKLEAAKKFNADIQAKVKADPAAAQKLMAELGPVMGEMMGAAMKIQAGMTKCMNDPAMLEVSKKWKQYQ